jgi:hypothetical protein
VHHDDPTASVASQPTSQRSWRKRVTVLRRRRIGLDACELPFQAMLKVSEMSRRHRQFQRVGCICLSLRPTVKANLLALDKFITVRWLVAHCVAGNGNPAVLCRIAPRPIPLRSRSEPLI